MVLFNWLRKKGRVESGSDEKTQPSTVGTAAEKSVYTEMTISGPFTSGNLSLFLLHGIDTMEVDHILTLEEALEKSKVIMEETGVVSQLKIKNGGEHIVFVQSGDIVKGGKQDRTLQHDMILPANSEFPISSYCVEQGRWQKRGREDASKFNQSNHYLSSKKLRMAAKHGQQHEVWESVHTLQYRTASNAHVPIDSVQGESASSLQLTLDSEKVNECTSQYVQDLSLALSDRTDVLGCAFAINGEMNSIDVYSSNSLLKKMAPKLLRAAAVEAFSELNRDKEFKSPGVEDVLACMKEPSESAAKVVAVNGKAKIVMQETKKNVLYETRDMMNGEKWLHRNYATK